MTKPKPERPSNLALWDAHRVPHKDAMKPFKRPGGFSGTAVDPMWMVRAATEEWGPMGDRWGVRVLEEKLHEGHALKSGGHALLHAVLIELWHPGADGSAAKVQAFGQTMMVGENTHGAYTDEEAPKKSLTDATSKALSMLGFAADVFMGAFDGNKYLSLRQDPVDSSQGGSNGSGGSGKGKAKPAAQEASKPSQGPEADTRKVALGKLAAAMFREESIQGPLAQLVKANLGPGSDPHEGELKSALWSRVQEAANRLGIGEAPSADDRKTLADTIREELAADLHEVAA